MGPFSFFKRKQAQPKMNTKPNTENAASLISSLVYYTLFCENESYGFGISLEQAESIINTAPVEIHLAIRVWGRYYVCWQFIAYCGLYYGESVRADAIALVASKLTPLRSSVPDTADIMETVTRVFNSMEKARFDPKPPQHDGTELPLVLRIAGNLLVLEGNLSNAEFVIEYAAALESLHEAAQDAFHHWRSEGVERAT